MSFLFKRLKLYPVLASFVAVKSVAHHQVNPPRYPRLLVGPDAPSIYELDAKLYFKRVMTEAAVRAQRFLEAQASWAHIPGISYSVAVDDQTPFSSSYGFADIENNIQLKDDSRLRIGYLSMLFTAVMSMQLVIDRRIGADEGVARILQLYPAHRLYTNIPHPININRLLSHTSGMRDYVDTDLFSKRNETTDMFYERELDVAQTMELGNPPGFYAHSRIGYMLLMTMIERSTSQSYEVQLLDFVRQHYARKFRIPGGMVDDTINVLPGLCRHYQRQGDGILEPAEYLNPKNRAGLYGIVAEPSFLCYLGHAIARSSQLWNRRLIQNRNSYNLNLTRDLARQMFAPINTANREPIYDQISGKIVHNCIFGKCLAEEHNTRSPMAWKQSSVAGASSALLVKGQFIGSQREQGEMTDNPAAFAPPHFVPYLNETTGSKPFACVDITVAVTCNLEGVHLFQLANQIAGVYQEAFEEFERWQKITRRNRPFVNYNTMPNDGGPRPTDPYHVHSPGPQGRPPSPGPQGRPYGPGPQGSPQAGPSGAGPSGAGPSGVGPSGALKRRHSPTPDSDEVPVIRRG